MIAPAATLAATRVVLVDDHPAMRAGIRLALETSPDIAVVGEAATGGDALALLERLAPEVVLLDIGLPDIDGISLIQDIRRVSSATRVVMLSCQVDEASVRLAVEAGANGYLTKMTGPRDMVAAVKSVRDGQVPLSPDVATHVLSALRHQRRGGEPSLTVREREVWRALARGLSNAQIASELYLSEHTVKFHVHNLLRKLGLRTRGEAICAAHNRGMTVQ